MDMSGDSRLSRGGPYRANDQGTSISNKEHGRRWILSWDPCPHHQIERVLVSFIIQTPMLKSYFHPYLPGAVKIIVLEVSESGLDPILQKTLVGTLVRPRKVGLESTRPPISRRNGISMVSPHLRESR